MSKAKMGSTAQTPKENENPKKKLDENILFIFDWLCDIAAAAAAAADRPKCIIIQKTNMIGIHTHTVEH